MNAITRSVGIGGGAGTTGGFGSSGSTTAVLDGAISSIGDFGDSVVAVNFRLLFQIFENSVSR
ncbi:MAG: hypothetical protein ACI9G1_003915 [Pirellulaceae bacterium]|jgi:hypothetical protein